MPALTACWTRPDKTPIIISMRTLFSYLLFVTLALSGLTGSVQSAHAYTLADALNQQSSQHGADTTAKMPCHSTKTAAVAPPEHDCCDQPKHQCKDDCCAKQCATSSALLATELFRYIRPDNTVAQQNLRLPQWLFAEDPPPPINA
ncbi:MAG: hypothetical protein KKE08_11360 [Gammaproteobacteria bacterium]|nr:hypothetical protein [Gammaproteobacteria bacterium]MBU2183614.1 hypothetical protein [Gammaproteobacteria bacterium]MBU2205624.1 hypothetical protein [Gammaproteobacteria bacterium]